MREVIFKIVVVHLARIAFGDRLGACLVILQRLHMMGKAGCRCLAWAERWVYHLQGQAWG
jgi:hypothetical protein